MLQNMCSIGFTMSNLPLRYGRTSAEKKTDTLHLVAAINIFIRVSQTEIPQCVNILKQRRWVKGHTVSDTKKITLLLFFLRLKWQQSPKSSYLKKIATFWKLFYEQSTFLDDTKNKMHRNLQWRFIFRRRFKNILVCV